MNLQKIRRLILLISLLLLPVTLFYLSPVLIIEGAAYGIFTGSAIIFTCIFLFSLIGGRLWCGWVCPFGSLQDLAWNIQGKRVINPWIDRFRYGLFVLWILMLIALFIRAGGITSIEPKTKTMNEVLSRLAGDQSKLILLPHKEGEYQRIAMAVNNMTSVKPLLATYLNIRDLLTYDKIIMPLESVDVITSHLG